MADFDEDKAEKKIEELHKKEEEDLAELLSAKYGIEYLDLSRHSIETDALRLIPEPEARQAKIAIFDAVGRKLKIAVLSPEADATKSVVEDLRRRNYEPTLFMVSKGSLERAWARYREISFASETKSGVLDISSEEIESFVSKVRSLGDVKNLINDVLTQKKSYRISRILEIIIAGALSMRASDIHIEPEESFVRLRYRLDGVLTDILNFDRETFLLLLSRIKLLSRLKLNVKNTAQDGRFSIKISDNEIEIRTSILPGAYSESIVLRVLDPETITVPMEELGIPKNLFKILEREIKRPDGMILNTGPTGSGKTTTLYAFLKKIETPEIKIITIEDPIEYHLPGITQSQVDHKEYTFAAGLRSALRQDPDVIMVGEIRDEETAETAINSALTGHLVLSTLHTNSAAGTYPRLIDLGVNPKVINSAINVAIAQRLLRKVCQNCAKQIPIPKDTQEGFQKLLKDAPGLPEKLQMETMPEPVGCSECNNLGYKGRIGIFEAIQKSEELNKIINENPSETEIQKVAEKQGLMTMRQDGLVKILSGLTTLSELRRVIDIEF